MDPSGRNKLEDCARYLKSKTILSASQSSDPALQQQIGTCFRQVYKEPFVKKMILPLYLIAGEALTCEAEENFGQAILMFFEHVRTKRYKPVKNNVGPYLFLLFKHLFLEQLGQKLWYTRCQRGNASETATENAEKAYTTGPAYDVTRSTALVLTQLSQEARDYFIWYYVDGFNVSQISTITGLTTEKTREYLWLSRENVSRTWKQVFAFPKRDILTQAQFWLLCKYFESDISSEKDEIFRELLYENVSLQENFEHELYLRYGIDKRALLAQMSQQSKEPFQTAEEFINWVKRIAESS